MLARGVCQNVSSISPCQSGCTNAVDVHHCTRENPPTRLKSCFPQHRYMRLDNSARRAGTLVMSAREHRIPALLAWLIAALMMFQPFSETRCLGSGQRTAPSQQRSCGCCCGPGCRCCCARSGHQCCKRPRSGHSNGSKSDVPQCHCCCPLPQSPLAPNSTETRDQTCSLVLSVIDAPAIGHPSLGPTASATCWAATWSSTSLDRCIELCRLTL